LQIPEQRHRRHFVKATVAVHHYPDGAMAISALIVLAVGRALAQRPAIARANKIG